MASRVEEPIYHAAQTSIGILRGVLPRDQSWQLPTADLRHGGGWRSYFGYLALPTEEDPDSREQRFDELTLGWAISSPEFRAELIARMNPPISDRFAFLGVDREAAREARMGIWEERLRGLATAFGISLDRLPPKKSATEKLVLAAALKCTTSVSIGWLAQRLEMGAPDSVNSLLHRFRVSGGMDRAQFKNVLSRFLA